MDFRAVVRPQSPRPAPTAKRKLSGARNDRREKGSDLPPKRPWLAPPRTAAGRTDELGRRAGQSCAPTAAVAGSARQLLEARPPPPRRARPASTVRDAPTARRRPLRLWKKERKEGGITSQFAGRCKAETTRPGDRPPIILGEVRARHRVRAGGANNWDLGGERSIMQCRACVDDTWLGVLHCIGS